MKPDKKVQPAPAELKADVTTYRKSAIALMLEAYECSVSGVQTKSDEMFHDHRTNHLFCSLAAKLYAEYSASLWNAKDEASIKLMQEVTRQHGAEESLRFVLEKILAPEANTGNEKAVRLLILFAIYLENHSKPRELSASLLAIASKTEIARETVTEQLVSAICHNYFKDKGATLIHVLYQVNRKCTEQMIQSKTTIGSNKEKIECLVLLAKQEHDPYSYGWFLRDFKFWGTKNADDFDLRELYYTIVLKAFQGKRLDIKSALDHLKPGYGKEEYDNRLEFLNKTVRLIAADKADDFIADCLITSAGKREFDGEKTFMAFAMKLDGMNRLRYFERALPKIEDRQTLWSIGKAIICQMEIGRACACLNRALDNQHRIDTLLQLILEVINDRHDFESIRRKIKVEGLEQLHHIALTCLEKTTETAEALAAIKAFAFYGGTKDMPAIINKIDQVINTAKENDLNEAVHMLLVIAARFEESSKLVFDLLNKRIFLQGWSEILKILIKVVISETSYGGERMYRPAIAFLTGACDQATIDELGQHLNSKQCNNTTDLLVDFLSTRAIMGNQDALNYLKNNRDGRGGADKVPKALAKIYRLGPTIIKKAAAEAIVKRFYCALLGGVHDELSYFAEFETAKTMKDRKVIREGFINAFANFPGERVPTSGIANLIEKADEILKDTKELERFRQVLTGVAERLTAKLKEMKETRNGWLREYESTYSHLMTAISKQLMA